MPRNAMRRCDDLGGANVDGDVHRGHSAATFGVVVAQQYDIVNHVEVIQPSWVSSRDTRDAWVGGGLRPQTDGKASERAASFAKMATNGCFRSPTPGSYNHAARRDVQPWLACVWGGRALALGRRGHHRCVSAPCSATKWLIELRAAVTDEPISTHPKNCFFNYPMDPRSNDRHLEYR